jgi:hypothetical protein
VREEAMDAFFVPPRRELRLSVHRFRRCRRLNAAKGFPVSS